MRKDREFLIAEQTEERKREKAKLDNHLQDLEREYKAKLEREGGRT